MKNTLNMEIKGHLQIVKTKGGEKEVVYDDHNALVTNYKNIIRHCIAGDATHFLDKIRVLKLGADLANTSINQVEYIALTDNEVKLVATFDETSFNDTFDEIYLYSAGGGDFSKVTGLSINKDNQTQLTISWTLKIINQP